mgnify:CR=1 FL=1
MKDKNIPQNTKSKSIKEIKEEINQILEKLENSATNLPDSMNDYARLIILNKQIESFFKNKNKEISTIGKKVKKNL